jgi:hypothetical protein
MAFGTYFNTDIGFGRANLDFISTCTSNIGSGIIRMDSLFHDTFKPPQNNFIYNVSGRPGSTFIFVNPIKTTAGKNSVRRHIQWKSSYVKWDIAITTDMVNF